jgi:hypothetical protein
MNLEIEYHTKVEILDLLKEKYGDKINNNLHSVKWVQYDNGTFLESIFKDNLSCIISEEMQIVISDYLTDSKGDLIYNRENEPISVDLFNPYEDIITNAHKFVDDEDDYGKINMVGNLFSEEYTNQIVFKIEFIPSFIRSEYFGNYLGENTNKNYLWEVYFGMLFNSLWNWKFDTFHAKIYTVIFKIINKDVDLICKDTSELQKRILVTIAIKQIVYEFYCVVCDDIDYNTLEAVESEIDSIIENRIFPQNNDLKECYEIYYQEILQKVKYVVIDHYESEVLKNHEYCVWWKKFLEDIDYELDYLADERTDKSYAMDDYLSHSFNY